MATRNMISFDWALKRLLRNKSNFEVLEGFLSELLQRGILVRSIAESEGNQTAKEDKYNRVDILVEADGREMVVIELQFDDQKDYFQRMIYGASKAITDHMQKGDPYSDVRKVYSVNIVHFDLGEGDDYIYHGFFDFTGLRKRDRLKLSKMQYDMYRKIYPGELCPEFFILKVKNFDDVATDTLDEWIYYLKNNKIKDDFTAQGLDKAREVLDFDNLSDEEKKEYLRQVEIDRIKTSELETAMYKGEAVGIEKGRAEGRAEGMEKGRAEGMEKGEALRNQLEADLAAKNAELALKSTQTALKLKQKGMSDEDISEITGLTLQQINNLT